MRNTARNTAIAASSGFSTVISINRPEGNTSWHIPSIAGALVCFLFDQREAVFEREGTNLIVKFSDGGSVVLVSFFAVGDRPLPAFKTVDGELLSSPAFLSSLDPDFDHSPAPPSSGTTYEDDAGELVEGIDGLDSTGAEYWSGEESGATDRYQFADETGGVGATGPSGSYQLLLPDGTYFEDYDNGSDFPRHVMAQARAVAYLGDAGEGAAAGQHVYSLYPDFVRTLPGADATAPALVACNAGAGDFFTTSWAGGELAISLTETGKQWLADNSGQELVGYFDIQAPGSAAGSYVLQAVFTPAVDFDSATTHLNTHYASGSSAFGETHQSINPGDDLVQTVVTTDNGDFLRFDRLDDASLNTGSGGDSLTVAGSVANCDIDMGTGTDTLRIRGQLVADSGTHAVTMEEGNLTVTSGEEEAAAVHAAGAQLNVNGNNADVTINATRDADPTAGVTAVAGGGVSLAGKNVDISTATLGGTEGTLGIVADGASVAIDATELLSVAAVNNGAGLAYAVNSANGGELVLSGQEVRLSASAAATGMAAAIAAAEGSNNRLSVTSTGDMDLQVDGGRNFSGGIMGRWGSTVEVNTGGDLNMRINTADNTGVGLRSDDVGTRLTAVAAGAVSIDVEGSGACGLRAYSGDLDVAAESLSIATRGVVGYAIQSFGGGTITVDTDSLTISSDFESENRLQVAVGASSVTESTNAVIHTNALVLDTALEGTGSLRALSAGSSNAHVEVNLKDSPTGASAAINAESTGSGVNQSHQSSVRGMEAMSGSCVLQGAENSVNTIAISSRGTEFAVAYGLHAYGNGSNVAVRGGNGADSITISAEAEMKNAHALWAGSSSRMEVAGGEGSTVALSAESANSYAYALETNGGGDIFLEGSHIDIRAVALNGTAMGVLGSGYRSDVGEIHIRGHESGLDLTITAQGKDASHAMYARSISKNIVEGSGSDDTIVMLGDLTGAANDSVYGNEISTGAGNDRMEVAGKIHDTRIDLGGGDDMLILRHGLGATVSEGVAISQIEGGAGFDILNLDDFAADNDFSLNDLGGMVLGFEQVDLSGASNSLLRLELTDLLALDDTLDGVLEGLAHSSGRDFSAELTSGHYMVVTGTEEDTVRLGAGITDEGSVVTDGAATYSVHSYTDFGSGEVHYLLLQQSLLVI